MSYLNQCNCESEKSDLQLELRDAKTKIITLERKLEEANREIERYKRIKDGNFEELMLIREVLLKADHNFGLACTIHYAEAVVNDLLEARQKLTALEGEKGGKNL